jgi:para-nitrobenzyl esterase
MSDPDADRPGGTSRRTLLAGAAAGITLASIGRKAGAQDASPVASPVVMTDVAQTTSGPVTGVVTDGVAAYKGIPYTVPLVDDLRWTPPQAMPSWTEPLAATDFCADCMQVTGPEQIAGGPSEDCLCLNVWRPYADVMIDALLPVLVWVHGGGYVGGGSSIPWYDGAAFARHGIVVVSFNYRLGRFGFFAPTALLDNTESPYANYGYLDQISVLRWIQENISAVGGDPARVTLMGESAGGASVIHLMTSPFVEDGLFQQAVILSGGGRLALLDRSMERESLTNLSAPAVDNLFAASIGVIGSGQDDLDELRAVPAGDLVDDLDLQKLAERKLVGGPMVGVPATDGEIVLGQPVDHFLDGSAKLMPVIIGTTAIDVPTHFPPNKLRPLSWFGPDEDAAKEAYGFGDDRFLGPSDLIALNLAIGSDMTMHEPAHFIASTMQDAGFNAWVYRFTYTAESTRPDQMEQVHAGELPFLFDNLTAKYGDAVTEHDQATASAFNAYVANFAIHGDPNGGDLPEWPPVTPAEFDVMNFTLDDGPVFGPDPRPSVALVSAAQGRHAAQNT